MVASNLVEPSSIQVSWDDIAGLETVIEELRETVILPIKAGDKAFSLNSAGDCFLDLTNFLTAFFLCKNNYHISNKTVNKQIKLRLT